MIARWCLSAFIFSLTLFGVLSQQQVSLPNQEVVLQFSEETLSARELQLVLSDIKHQLLESGVSNLQVKANDNGEFRISYYSTVDVAIIKKVFNDEAHLELAHAEHQQPLPLPSEDHSKKYNVDVYEIQSGNTTDWDFKGTLVLQVDSKSDRFISSNTLFSVDFIDTSKAEITFQTAFKVCQNIFLDFQDGLHVIPEVRAGPIC
ncbi:hypothetical protein JJL45_14060 [Tamlana sp. s12]|uniref:hypothetical protein n=1 Tax=Tamlana sp. s12 TaxID=1630406 RepID=UPI0007FCF77E|nr:hypothetical protein [Tamlana sp. s12]OBQ56349.1 hypothetical protein VQ01_03050 [Tamlana sp. s12]QQY82034.1 hypothetical protein JJL45_14060 [Tamlana sp. s12]